MTKRLTESVKLIQKAYRRKMKKQRWEKTVPSFKNLGMTVKCADFTDEINLVVTNLLEIEEKAVYAKINGVSEFGSNYLISSIKCPFCHKPLIINRHWNCFICSGGEHERKVFEILRVKMPNEIQKIVEEQEMV